MSDKNQSPPARATRSKRTFEEHDLFDLKKFAENINNQILVHYYIEDDSSVIVSLDGKFGAGKSFFMDMYKSYLEEKGQQVLKIDAWRGDIFDDPLFTIASELIEYLNEHSGITSEEIEKNLKNILVSLLAFAAPVINGAISKLIGFDLAEGVESAKNASSTKEPGQILYERSREKKGLLIRLNTALAEYVSGLISEKEKILYIFVDELDRARPDYAISFLETLKHLFAVRGIVFVIGVNKEQLASSVKTLYGHETNFDEYYRKFVQLDIKLPSTALPNTKRFLEKKLEDIISKLKFDGKVTISESDNKEATKDIAKACHDFGLSPRQTNDVLKHITYYLLDKKDPPKRIISSTYLSAAAYYAIFRVAFAEYSFSEKKTDFTECLEIIAKKSMDKESSNFHAYNLIIITSDKSSYERNKNAFIHKFYSDKSEIIAIREKMTHHYNSLRMYNGPYEHSIMSEVISSMERCKSWNEDP